MGVERCWGSRGARGLSVIESSCSEGLGGMGSTGGGIRGDEGLGQGSRGGGSQGVVGDRVQMGFKG